VALPRPRVRRLSATLALACVSASAAQAPAPESVTDLLRALGSRGIVVLFSSDLVPPNLTAPAVLYGSDPMARTVEALAAHHLRLQSLGPRRYVVTRDPRPIPSTLSTTAATKLAPTSTELDEVSVFASRYAFGMATPGAPSSLGRSDIDRMPGAQSDPIRAVRATPGLATNLSSRPYVRGAFLDDVLVQFDGIPLVDPFHFKNFQDLVSALDASAIDRIDVYTGGFPVKYGTRSAGVIDLEPRSVESGFEHGVAASLLSYDLSTVGRSDRWPIEWLATVRHSARDVVLKPLDADIGEPTFYDALGRARWQASAASAWTLAWLMLDDRLRLATDPAEAQAAAHFRDLYSWLVWDQAWTGAVHSRTSVSMTRAQHARSGALTLAGFANGRLEERRDFSSLDFRTGWTYVPSAGVTWDAGAETVFERAELRFARQERFADLIAASFNRSSDATLSANVAPRSSTLALFTSVRRQWRLLEAEVGLRLDRQDGRSLGTHMQVTPRFNLRYDPTPEWHVYGSWGEFSQAQRVSEWRVEEGQAAPDAATRASHVITGLAHETESNLQWRLEAYRNHWSAVGPYFDNSLDSLSLLPELEPDRRRVAPADAETAGVELSVRRPLSARVQLWGTYAVSRTTDDLAGRDVPRSWDQTHAATLALAWQGVSTSASALLGWHTGWPRTPLSPGSGTAAAPGGLLVGERNSARWANYLTVDLRVSHEVPVPAGSLSAWLDATNATDRSNECCVGFSPADTTAGMAVTRAKLWLPRVVNVGFAWRFRREP
jgi:TonB-dependent receptor-like protein